LHSQRRMHTNDVWILTGTEDELRQAAQVSPGDLVLQDRGEVLGVGRVDDQMTVAWTEEVDAGLLPDRQRIAEDTQRPGPTQRIEDAPALFTALQRIEEADELRGG
jgi:hypothetical protein